MFKLVTVEDTIRVSPDKFGKPLERVTYEELKMRYEGIISEELGYVIAVTDIKVDAIGKIIPGDGATFHRVLFTLLTYYPKIQEVVEGEIVEVEDFGAFVRIGPIDALLHVSQIIDDFVSFDERHGTLIAKETQRRLKRGDLVRTRITAVSLAKGGSSGKIGITMRQPFLGKLEWIAEDVKKVREVSAGATA
ncbi:MAG: DNA-directed RNA polymerase [Candidatus Bathyarchaeia archaeon]